MKITVISDIHGNLINPDKFNRGNILCICGDICPLDIQRDVIKSIAWFCMKFVPWTDKLPFEKVIVIFGNHDFMGEELGPKRNNTGKEITSMLLPGSIKGEHKIVILCDNGFKYNHKTFYGTSWISDLSNWAFYGNSEALKEKFSKIPEGVDVLLTHCPPRIGNVGTVLQNGQFNFLTNYGCQELTNVIDNKNPKYVFCGHVHTGDHNITEFKDSKIVNVSLLDERYTLQYKPFEIEI